MIKQSPRTLYIIETNGIFRYRLSSQSILYPADAGEPQPMDAEYVHDNDTAQNTNKMFDYAIIFPENSWPMSKADFIHGMETHLEKFVTFTKKGACERFKDMA